MVALATAVSVRRARPRLDLLATARRAERTYDDPERFRRELTHVLGQRKLFQKFVPGLMHAFIFWGFLVLFPTIVEAALAIVDPDLALPWLGDAPWFITLVDVFATLVVVGVAIAFAIRKVQRPDRFRGSHLREADLILLRILGIVTTLLLWNAARIALGEFPDPSCAPRSRTRSRLLFAAGRPRPSSGSWSGRTCCWCSASSRTCPGSKHLHIITAAPNVYLAKNAPERPPRAAPDRPGGRRGRHALRRGDRDRPLAQAGARSVLVHGVRPLPGGVPRLEHRQAPQSRSC